MICAAFKAVFDRFRKPDLSIIVPVYNAMPYFEECIASIVTQDVAPYKYEVLLVDDGSTDASGEFCDAVAAEYPCFRVIHQSNSGDCSTPRNVALGRVRGRYIFMCDADDWFYPGALSAMLDHARVTKCDVGVFMADDSEWGRRACRVYDAGSQRHCSFRNSEIARTYGVWKLISRSLIERNRIRFVEGISPEDWAFTLECYLRARNVCVFADRYYYRYRCRQDGKSLVQRAGANMHNWWGSYMRAFRAYLNVANNLADNEDKPAIYARLARACAKYIEMVADYRLPESCLDDVRGLLAGKIDDCARALMSLNQLMAVDALLSGADASRIRAVIMSYRRCGVSFCDEKVQTSYVVTSEAGEVVAMRELPAAHGIDLIESQYAAAVVRSICFMGSSLEIRGDSALLCRTGQKVRFDGLLVAAFKRKGENLIEIAIDHMNRSLAFPGTEYVQCSWTASVEFDKLTELCNVPYNDAGLRLDFRIAAMRDAMPLKTRVAAGERSFFEDIRYGGCVFRHFITEYGNFSLNCISLN